MKINHLGFFVVSKGEHQGRYALMEFTMKDGKTKTSRSTWRVGVMVSQPRKVERSGPAPEWSFDDPSSITPDKLFSMVNEGKLKKQADNKIILWTNKGPVYDPPATVLPKWYRSRLVTKAKQLLSLPASVK